MQLFKLLDSDYQNYHCCIVAFLFPPKNLFPSPRQACHVVLVCQLNTSDVRLVPFCSELRVLQWSGTV